jgi:hypothetical protein
MACYKQLIYNSKEFIQTPAMNDKDNTRTYLFYGLKGISTISINIFTIAVSFRRMLLLYPKTRFYHRECDQNGCTQGVTKRRYPSDAHYRDGFAPASYWTRIQISALVLDTR